MLHRRLFVVVFLCMTMAVVPVAAHSPIFSDGSAISSEMAISIADVAISRVVYHEVTDGQLQLWIKYTVTAGQQVTFQLGVPLIDRLSDFRPALAIVGPGLPEVDLPFEMPVGTGGEVLAAQEGVALEEFHERFTGTDSWIVGELTVTFPQAGEYYAVAYVPDGQTGKLWVAFGDQEVFGLGEILSFGEIVNRARAFHEVAPALIPCFVPLMGAVMLSAAVMVRLHSSQRRRLV